jgi:phosphoesterase RecJ-like protein
MDAMQRILKIIRASRRIIITTHVNPDGDAVGASLGLFLGIRKWASREEDWDPQIRIVLEDKAPDTTAFLPYYERLERWSSDEHYEGDLLICLDAADLKRLGKTAVLAEDHVVVNIDHHITNPGYGKYNYVKDISSTSEIIFRLLQSAGAPLDTEIGECLYTGLVNDTGNFSHDNVTKDTLYMAGTLVGIGVDNAKIIREFLENKSYGAIKLIGEALYYMQFYPEEKLAYYYLPYAEMIRHGGRKEDTESIVERLIEYNEAEAALFIREEETGLLKGSMRSKVDSVDVAKIAGCFGGGGHKKAAGFTAKGTADAVLAKVLRQLSENERKK